MIRSRALWLSLCTLGLASAVAAQVAVSEAPGAQLRGIDKINGEIFNIDLPVGQTAVLERIEITLTSCRYPIGNPSGDAYAALEISEVASDSVLFSGWMIASSPALSALDHQRYDVWVMRCTTS